MGGQVLLPPYSKPGSRAEEWVKEGAMRLGIKEAARYTLPAPLASAGSILAPASHGNSRLPESFLGPEVHAAWYVCLFSHCGHF